MHFPAFDFPKSAFCNLQTATGTRVVSAKDVFPFKKIQWEKSNRKSIAAIRLHFFQFAITRTMVTFRNPDDDGDDDDDDDDKEQKKTVMRCGTRLIECTSRNEEMKCNFNRLH